MSNINPRNVAKSVGVAANNSMSTKTEDILTTAISVSQKHEQAVKKIQVTISKNKLPSQADLKRLDELEDQLSNNDFVQYSAGVKAKDVLKNVVSDIDKHQESFFKKVKRKIQNGIAWFNDWVKFLYNRLYTCITTPFCAVLIGMVVYGIGCAISGGGTCNVLAPLWRLLTESFQNVKDVLKNLWELLSGTNDQPFLQSFKNIYKTKADYETNLLKQTCVQAATSVAGTLFQDSSANILQAAATWNPFQILFSIAVATSKALFSSSAVVGSCVNNQVVFENTLMNLKSSVIKDEREFLTRIAGYVAVGSGSTGISAVFARSLKYASDSFFKNNEVFTDKKAKQLETSMGMFEIAGNESRRLQSEINKASIELKKMPAKLIIEKVNKNKENRRSRSRSGSKNRSNNQNINRSKHQNRNQNRSRTRRSRTGRSRSRSRQKQLMDNTGAKIID